MWLELEGTTTVLDEGWVLTLVDGVFSTGIWGFTLEGKTTDALTDVEVTGDIVGVTPFVVVAATETTTFSNGVRSLPVAEVLSLTL